MSTSDSQQNNPIKSTNTEKQNMSNNFEWFNCIYDFISIENGKEIATNQDPYLKLGLSDL